MHAWPPRPLIYEINTWVWLDELSQAIGQPITLNDVPDKEWQALAAMGIDTVWLMGVWERSPAGTEIANQNPALMADFHQALPDFQSPDNVGSPYCVRRYIVDAHLGGNRGLIAARKALARHGIRLILDFVPNHVAPDHPWASEHPEFFIQGSREDLQRAPSEFFEVGDKVLARGRDPYFPPWMDVLQLNAFHPGLRQAHTETLLKIAALCDGLRCDMAMLMINHVFFQTWGQRAGAPPMRDYWRQVIPAVKARYPNTRFIAEAYWDLEWELQQQGFDYCYDKRLYDRLERDNADSVRLHLQAGLEIQEKMVRFIENHDEPRAAAVFAPQKERAAALASSTLPGAVLFHEGQFEGRKVKLPVFLRRRPVEIQDASLIEFYLTLLKIIQSPVFRQGEWQLCAQSGWPDNLSYLNLVAWCWHLGEERRVVVVNLSSSPAQGRVRLPWDDLTGGYWRLTDLTSSAIFDRDGDEMIGPGIYVDLPPWGYHVFSL